MHPRAKAAIAHGLRFVGKPYIWAGQGPLGLDCSGLIVEVLRSIGVVDRRYDNTAQGLWDQMQAAAKPTCNPGDLVFFGIDRRHITHVGLVIDVLPCGTVLVLEAAGGRRGVDTPEEAQANQAMVTVRPLRNDVCAIADPFLWYDANIRG